MTRLVAVTVTAFRSNGSGGWDYVNDTSTNATSGDYDLGGRNLAAGDYRIEFRDDSGTYLTEWFDDRPDGDSADDVAGERGGDDLRHRSRSLLWLVTSPARSQGRTVVVRLVVIVVTAYRSDGSGGLDYVSDTTTNATDGSYDLGGLAAGDYRIEFHDRSCTYVRRVFRRQARSRVGR